MTVAIFAGMDLKTILPAEELDEYVALYFQHDQGD